MIGVEVVNIFTAIGQDVVQGIQPIGAVQVSEGGGLAVVGDVLAGALPKFVNGVLPIAVLLADALAVVAVLDGKFLVGWGSACRNTERVVY